MTDIEDKRLFSFFRLMDLAKHAPTEPQAWFQPVMPPEPAAPEYAASDEVRRSINAARRAWAYERDKQTRVQWPRAWAEAVLATFPELQS